jgi:hypothetical protein
MSASMRPFLAFGAELDDLARPWIGHKAREGDLWRAYPQNALVNIYSRDQDGTRRQTSGLLDRDGVFEASVVINSLQELLE